MSPELEKFTISDEIFDKVTGKIDSSENLMSYVRSTLLRMSVEQPVLLDFTKGVASKHDPLPHGTGAAFAFDIITSQLQENGVEITIDEDDIRVHEENIIDFFIDIRWQNIEWAERELDKGNRPSSDPTWIKEKLTQISDEIVNFVNGVVAELNNDELRSSFLRGIIDVTGPFLSKIEAENLGNFWFPEN